MTPLSWRDSRHPDHYYWMTSKLDAHGARAGTCRLIAAFTVIGGLIPMLFVFGAGTGSQTPVRATAIAVTVICELLSVLWLRGVWPTRIQSTVCAVTGCALSVICCLLVPDMLIGLVGSGVFVAVVAYTSIFHAGRLVAGVVAVALVVIAVNTVRVAMTTPAIAIGLGVTITLILAMVTFIVQVLMALIETDAFTGDIEPVTGLLSYRGFQDGIAVMVAARGRTDDRFLVLMLIGLDSFAAITDMNGGPHGRQIRVAVGQMLREVARRDALIAHITESEFLVADVFNTDDPAPLCARIQAGVAIAAPELTASIGAAVTPLTPLSSQPPEDISTDLLSVATEAMQVARRGGGHQTHMTYVPGLSPPDIQTPDPS